MQDDHTEVQVVTLTFFRMQRWRDRLWAFAQMGLARGPLSRLPGIGWSAKRTLGVVAGPNCSMSKAWSAEVLAPVSILNGNLLELLP